MELKIFCCNKLSVLFTNLVSKFPTGIATFKGIWPTTSSGSANTSSYKIRPGDFVHAMFSLIVFGVVSLLDSNTVDCFYPSFESNQKAIFMALPPAIGAISSAVFVLFPNTRHGIGYPPSSSQSSNDSYSLLG